MSTPLTSRCMAFWASGCGPRLSCGAWRSEFTEFTARARLALDGWHRVRRWRLPSCLTLLSCLSLLSGGNVVYGREGQAQPESSSRPSGAMVLDRIVVVVNGQPLTRSRLLLFESVLRLYGDDPGWPVREEGGLQNPAELEQWAVLEELLYEASSAGAGVRLTRSVVDQELERLRVRWGGEAGWRAVLEKLGMGEGVLRERVARRLRIQAYVQARLGTVRVSEKEVQEHYELLRAQLVGLTLEEGRSLALQQLKVERQRVLFWRWAEELRERASIQVPSREVLP